MIPYNSYYCVPLFNGAPLAASITVLVALSILAALVLS